MDRDPFPRAHSRREPQPDAEEVARDRMQLDRAMRLAAMQEDGDGSDGDVGQPERDQHVAPPGEIEYAREQARHACSLLKGCRGAGGERPGRRRKNCYDTDRSLTWQ